MPEEDNASDLTGDGINKYHILKNGKKKKKGKVGPIVLLFFKNKWQIQLPKHCKNEFIHLV